MRLPNIKKISREDLKEAPSWINALIDPLNSFMETVYQSLNKNITFTENIASNIKEIVVTTTASYPTMDEIEIMSGLRTRATGVIVSQAYVRGTYVPAAGPVYVAWVEENGNIRITGITGLSASTSYLIRLLIY